MLRDLKFAFRSLRRTPVFSLTVIATLALGIGANSAIFNVVNGVLLKPLPYPDPDNLVLVYNHLGTDDRQVGVSGPAVLDFKDRADLFEGFSTAMAAGTNLVGPERPVRITLSWVMQDFFDVLGAPAEVGRTFAAEDVRQFDREALLDPNFQPPPAAAVISYGLWNSLYGSDPEIVGNNFRLNGQLMTVVGVMPRDFQVLLPPDATMPTDIDVWTLMPVDASRMPRNAHQFTVFGRIKPGVRYDAAVRQMDEISSWQRANFQHEATADVSIGVRKLHDGVVGSSRAALSVLLGAVAFVLLIACANVASLMLTRSISREKESAIRSALGGTTLDIARGRAVEIVLLALAGGVTGLVLADRGVALLLALRPEGLARLDAIGMDPITILFTAGIAILAAALAGVMPAIRASRPNLATSLRERSGTGSHRALESLVVAEVGLSLVLLVAAGLMVKTFAALQRVDTGFESRNVVTARIALPFFSYLDPEKRGRLFDDVIGRVESLPDVVAAGGVSRLPLEAGGPSPGPYALDQGDTDGWTNNRAQYRAVLPGYFESMGIRLQSGRFIERTDNIADAAPVIVVNQLMADRVWPGENPVGRNLWVTRRDSTLTGSLPVAATVVGVVGNVQQGPLASEKESAIYFPYRHWYEEEMTLTVLTSAPNPGPSNTLRDLVASIDGELPVFDIEPMAYYESAALSQTRFLLFVITVFAATAGLLAVVGLYGVISYTVSDRTREIGVRIAFGATRGRIISLVLGRGMRLAAMGIAGGVLMTVVVSGVLRGILFGIAPTDPLTIAFLAVIFLAVAAMATLIPAARATRVDPMEAIGRE